MSKIACIIQARTGSSRLPGKVLKKILGKPLLEHLVERLKRSQTIDEIVIATTLKSSDRAIIDLAEKCAVQWYAGSEDDVLSRYVGAAKKVNSPHVIRVTSDCPLIDPETIDKVVNQYKKTNVDYVSNTLERTYPRGLDAEIFSMEALEKADKAAVDQSSREHVTLYMYRHPEHFSLSNVRAEPPLNRPDLRLCVDTEEDFRLIKEIYEALYKPEKIIDVLDVLNLLMNERPELVKINAHIEQKKV